MGVCIAFVIWDTLLMEMVDQILLQQLDSEVGSDFASHSIFRRSSSEACRRKGGALI